MGHSGYIDWHRVGLLPSNRGETYVYAFWMVDYGRSDRDLGVTLFKREGAHPDWFLHAERADHHLVAYSHAGVAVSGNFAKVFDPESLTSSPLLGSVLLGTVNRRYLNWHCTVDDLDRRGRKLVKDLSIMYLRPAQIITFVDLEPMNDVVPEAVSDQATVAPGLGASTA